MCKGRCGRPIRATGQLAISWRNSLLGRQTDTLAQPVLRSISLIHRLSASQAESTCYLLFIAHRYSATRSVVLCPHSSATRRESSINAADGHCLDPPPSAVSGPPENTASDARAASLQSPLTT